MKPRFKSTVYLLLFGFVLLFCVQMAYGEETGRLQWKFYTGNAVYSSIAIGLHGAIYFSSNDGYLYAINKDNGSLIWKFDIGSTLSRSDYIVSSPSVGTNGIVYVGSANGYLYAINPVGL